MSAPPVPLRNKKKVLCLDGGGMRGLATLVLLHKLESGTGKRVHELFDLICGVSTGAILAVCLGLLKLSILDTRKIYLEMGQQVFAESKSLIETGYYYDADRLKDFLRSRLGERKLSDFPPVPGQTPHVVIASTSVEMLPPERCLFRNFQGDAGNDYSSAPVWVALRASTAAPTYFPMMRFQNRAFVDGGLGANNPTVIGLSVAQDLWGLLSVTMLVSVGTGKSPKRRNMSIPAESASRSMADSISGEGWLAAAAKQALKVASAAAPIVSLFESAADIAISSEGDSDAVRLIMEGHPELSYYRFNPTMEVEVGLDCTDLKTLTELENCMARHIVREELLKFTQCVSLLCSS